MAVTAAAAAAAARLQSARGVWAKASSHGCESTREVHLGEQRQRRRTETNGALLAGRWRFTASRRLLTC